MSNYLYTTFLLVVYFYVIVDSLYSFNKGKYNPYIFSMKQTNKQAVFNFVMYMAVSWSVYNILSNIKTPLHTFQLFFIVFLFCSTLVMNVLNYLSYAKIKDLKIILQTVIYDICAIAFCLYLLQLQ